MKMKEVDYKEIGLKVGLEIHQQLATRTKLFCPCPAELGEEEYDEFERMLRPTRSDGLNRALKIQNTVENRFENLGLNYHQKILDGFDTLQKRNPNRIIRVNADNDKEFISDEISFHIKEILTIND
jgi:Glu-tRNA(Gln) amidotransferase subunit E-like FAD-binding protein